MRLVALLGIGLMAAALLLPSSDAPVVVPADTLQPASDLASTPDPADQADGRGAAAPTSEGSLHVTASTAASVAGEDLERADRAQASAARKRAKLPANRPPKPKSKPKRQTKRASAPAPAPASAPVNPSRPPVAQPTPSPSPTPAPAPAKPVKARPRGGPSAEFGGF